MRSALTVLVLALILARPVAAQVVVDPPTLTWAMTGNTAASTDTLGSPSTFQWRIVGCADLNGDGISDLVWINKQTQQVAIWYLGYDGYNVSLASGAMVAGATLTTPLEGYRWELTIVKAPTLQFVWRQSVGQ